MAKRVETASSEKPTAKQVKIVASIGAIKSDLNTHASDIERACRDAVVSVHKKSSQAFVWVSDARTLSVTDAVAPGPTLLPCEVIPYSNGTATITGDSPDWEVVVSQGSKQKSMSYRAVTQGEKPGIEFPDAFVRAGLTKDDPGVEWHHFTPDRLARLIDSIGAQKNDDIAFGVSHIPVGPDNTLRPILIVAGAHGVAIVTCPCDNGIKPMVDVRQINSSGKSEKTGRELPTEFVKRVMTAACKSWADSFSGKAIPHAPPVEKHAAWSQRYGVNTREIEWHKDKASTGASVTASRKGER